MTSLMNRPNFFNEMVSLPEAVSSLFENSFLSPTWSSNFEQRRLVTAFNVYEDSSNYYILGLLPGLNLDKFDLNVKENVLTISGTYTFGNWPQINGQPSGQPNSQPENKKGETKENAPAIRTLLKEIPEGQFYRQIQLPGSFDSDKIEAHYEDGLLKLLLPKTLSSQTRRIQVQTGKKPNFMEGQLVGASKDN